MKAEERPLNWNLHTDTERQQEDLKCCKPKDVWRRLGSRKKVRKERKGGQDVRSEDVTQTLLHTDPLTQKRLYTQTPLHTQMPLHMLERPHAVWSPDWSIEHICFSCHVNDFWKSNPKKALRRVTGSQAIESIWTMTQEIRVWGFSAQPHAIATNWQSSDLVFLT